MSLSKQLLILITFIFLIVFSVNFILSINNIKSYLEVESGIHVQDTATSLGLSLSPHMADDEQDPILRTMINAIFDKGYYKEILLVNVDDEVLIRLSNPEKIENVPEWIIKLMPMGGAIAVSEISSGWNISGTLYVTANPGYGYLKLYEQGKTTLEYSLLMFLAAMGLLIVVLRFTLKSLKDIEKQSNDISAGNFTIIKDLPWTLEVRNVAKSMNGMSNKIGAMIARLNSKLESLSDNLKRDSLTKLLNQTTFNVDLRQALATGKPGYAAFIKFDDLAFIAKNKGNKVVNELLINFANLLIALPKTDSTAYRLYGSEFALLCPNFNNSQMNVLAEQLKQDISLLGKQYELDDLVHMGIIRFERTSDFSKLSPAMMEAYEQARTIGSNAYFIKEDSISSMTELDWKAMIHTVLENDMPEITLKSEAYNYSGEHAIQVMEEAFTVIKDDAGNTLSIGTFFSMAEEFDLEEELDKCIVNKIILLMEKNNQSTPVTINLSMTSIASPSFAPWLQARIQRSSLPHELFAFSVTAYSATKDLDAFANFSIFVKLRGATTLLKRYSSDIIPVDTLKKLHIDYIRLSRDVTTDISNDSNKSDLLDIMHEVTNLLNIKVIAEDVLDDNDFELVKKANIYGIGR